MRQNFKLIINCAILLLPIFGLSQVTTDSLNKAADSLSKTAMDSLANAMTPKDTIKVDTIKVVIDTVVKKDCYTEYYDIMRTRGAKPVTDGMQQVVIALKTPESCNCFLGQIEVAAGKIKPPLYFQQENGEYKLVSTVGKKLETAFVSSMSPDELFMIKDGMSIVFRTSDNEYGRLFFYKFANKGAQSNKVAPSPSDLIKD